MPKRKVFTFIKKNRKKVLIVTRHPNTETIKMNQSR